MIRRSKIPKREILIENGYGVVPLSRGLSSIIDIDDINLVQKYNWCAQPKTYRENNDSFYAVTNIYSDDRIRNRIYLHRLIFNVESNYIVDHINGNGLDNRKENLRLSSIAENAQNSKIPITNTSGYKGIYFDKKRNKYCCQISAFEKHIHIGYFNDIKDAQIAYLEASVKYHKKFSRIK